MSQPRYVMMTGDCLQILPSHREKAYKVVVTSPPYNLRKDYGESKDNLPHSEYLRWMTQVWKELFRVTRDDGHFFLQVGGTPSKPMLPEEILATALEAGWKLQNSIVWIKSISIGDRTHGHFKPINSERYLNHTFEWIYHLTKDGKQPIQRLAIGVPYTDTTNQTRWKSASVLRCRGNAWHLPYETINDSVKDRAGHPCPFPVVLPEMCIKLAGAEPKDWVLDPFAGTGATLMAAQRVGCCGAGVELEKHFTEEAERRLGILQAQEVQ